MDSDGLSLSSDASPQPVDLAPEYAHEPPSDHPAPAVLVNTEEALTTTTNIVGMAEEAVVETCTPHEDAVESRPIDVIQNKLQDTWAQHTDLVFQVC